MDHTVLWLWNARSMYGSWKGSLKKSALKNESGTCMVHSYSPHVRTICGPLTRSVRKSMYGENTRPQQKSPLKNTVGSWAEHGHTPQIGNMSANIDTGPDYGVCPEIFHGPYMFPAPLRNYCLQWSTANNWFLGRDNGQKLSVWFRQYFGIKN